MTPEHSAREETSSLDELTIPAAQTGIAVQRLGVTVQLCTADGHLPVVRRAALTVLREILDLAPGQFPWWMGGTDAKPRRIPEAGIERIFDSALPLIEQPDQLLSLSLVQRENPPRWQAEAMMLAEDPRRSWLSHVTFSAPPSFALSNPQDYVQLVARWAQALRPHYGTAGLALVDQAGMAHHRGGAALPWLHRYPGLDCAPFNLQPKPARYVAVNWLTVIGEPVIQALGGEEQIRSLLALASDTRGVEHPEILRYDGGMVIRASELPLLGDRSTADVPGPYRAVNAALRTARFEEYPQGPNIHLIDAPRTSDRRQATLNWVRRFDD
ncbi:type VI immunity family protein [Glutamicibacter sp. NPDC087344]|uniref:type VI immunity family protein n=1 Tax=Glutamicibacter sp. NPDC087344 TaxID=3363994 RepID=UPI00382E7196